MGSVGPLPPDQRCEGYFVKHTTSEGAGEARPHPSNLSSAPPWRCVPTAGTDFDRWRCFCAQSGSRLKKVRLTTSLQGCMASSMTSVAMNVSQESSSSSLLERRRLHGTDVDPSLLSYSAVVWRLTRSEPPSSWEQQSVEETGTLLADAVRAIFKSTSSLNCACKRVTCSCIDSSWRASSLKASRSTPCRDEAPPAARFASRHGAAATLRSKSKTGCCSSSLLCAKVHADPYGQAQDQRTEKQSCVRKRLGRASSSSSL
mmetsp:Transcript_54158/g.136816  ORF Transcript_54158/g.136816 Transcript_54158/m.136816 type:complete len:259 (+) Transcript_54158:378-1154(+)